MKRILLKLSVLCLVLMAAVYANAWTATLLYTNSPFAIVPFTPPPLTAGQSYDVQVTFTPTNSGWFTNYVIFAYSNGVTFSTNMVYGKGVIPPQAPTNLRIISR